MDTSKLSNFWRRRSNNVLIKGRQLNKNYRPNVFYKLRATTIESRLKKASLKLKPKRINKKVQLSL